MESTRSVEIGRKVRAARALSGKEVVELAHAARMSKRKWWRLERGEQVPDLVEIELIAAATGQPVGFFFGASAVDVEGQGTVRLAKSGVKQ